MTGAASAPPLIAHVVHRFDYGGLENGIVNLINRMPEDAFRHCVIALTEATEFRNRITRPDVEVYSIGKKPGKDFGAYRRLLHLLRKLRPAILHTRNFGTIDCAFIGWLARVPVRIHGEHGWDIYDPDGTNRKYRLMRRVLARFITRFVTVSEDLRQWLIRVVGIDEASTQRICNGVDTERFFPRSDDARSQSLPPAFAVSNGVIIGSVLRFSPIKDPMNLVRAFIHLNNQDNVPTSDTRLIMIGGGELHPSALDSLRDADVIDKSWLPGGRDDVPEIMRSMDVFVLGSLREGISNTILEAMASGLPVIATATGGNHELVVEGETGALVPPGDSDRLAKAIADYLRDPDTRRRHGRRARERAVSQFSLDTMVTNYLGVYENALSQARG